MKNELAWREDGDGGSYRLFTWNEKQAREFLIQNPSRPICFLCCNCMVFHPLQFLKLCITLV